MLKYVHTHIDMYICEQLIFTYIDFIKNTFNEL